MEFLLRNALRPDGFIEHIPALPVLRHGFAKKFAAIWSAMAEPKMQDRARAASPDRSSCTEPPNAVPPGTHASGV